jgi:hypothetical protein
MYRSQSHRSFISFKFGCLGHRMCVGNPLPSEVARGEEQGIRGEEEIAQF